MWIKLAAEEKFAHLETAAGAFVGKVASLACASLAWGLASNRVRIHLVAESGTAVPTPATIDAALAREPLEVSAVVTSGAWLVAVPIAPDGSGGGGAGAFSV